MLKVLSISDKVGAEQRPVPARAPRSRPPDHNECCDGWLDGSSSSHLHQHTAERRSSTPSQSLPTLIVEPHFFGELHAQGCWYRAGEDITDSRLFWWRYRVVVLEPLRQKRRRPSLSWHASRQVRRRTLGADRGRASCQPQISSHCRSLPCRPLYADLLTKRGAGSSPRG